MRRQPPWQYTKKNSTSGNRPSTLSRPTTASAARLVRSEKSSNINSSLSSSPSSSSLLTNNGMNSPITSSPLAHSKLSTASVTNIPPKMHTVKSSSTPPTPVIPVELTEQDIDFLPDLETIDAQYSADSYYTPVELPEYIENEAYYQEERLAQLEQMNDRYHSTTLEQQKKLGKG